MALSNYAKKLREYLRIWNKTAIQYLSTHVNPSIRTAKVQSAFNELVVDEGGEVKLHVPTRFSISNVSDETVFTWDNVINAITYVIESSTDEDFTTSVELTSTNDLTFVTTLIPENGGFFRIKATATGFIDSDYSPVIS